MALMGRQHEWQGDLASPPEAKEERMKMPRSAVQVAQRERAAAGDGMKPGATFGGGRRWVGAGRIGAWLAVGVLSLAPSGRANVARAESVPAGPSPSTEQRAADVREVAGPAVRWLGHRLGFGAGLLATSLRDEGLNPTRFSGIGAAIELGWWHETARLAQAAQLRLLFSDRLSNRFDPLPTGLLVNPRLGYSFRWKFAFPAAGLTLLAGGGVRSDIQLSYFPLWDDSHAYWISAYELRAEGGASWKRGRHRLSADIGLPLMALVSRPPSYRTYKVDNPDHIFSLVHQGPALTSLHEHLTVDLRLGWSFPLSSRWTQTLAYELGLVRSERAGAALLVRASHVFSLRLEVLL